MLEGRERNPTHRLLRAAYYTKKIAREPDNCHVFTNAAFQGNLGGLAFTISHGTDRSITQPCASSVEAELLAVTLAAAHNSSDIHTHSQLACSHFAQGLVFPSALLLLSNIRRPFHIHWIPGHIGIAGNEHAHQLARKTLLRAPADACCAARSSSSSPYPSQPNCLPLRFPSSPPAPYSS